jgi:nucleotide-binding universal stress UspA family protein
MVKNILVPIDGSKQSEKVVEFATGMALQYNADLHLFYVVEKHNFPDEIIEYIQKEKIDGGLGKLTAQVIGEALLKPFISQIKDKGVKKAKWMVVRGNPAEEIVKFAKNKNIDLIVIGSRGFGKIKGLILGSVSNKVCQLAECSCLTVN